MVKKTSKSKLLNQITVSDIYYLFDSKNPRESVKSLLLLNVVSRLRNSAIDNRSHPSGIIFVSRESRPICALISRRVAACAKCIADLVDFRYE